MRLPEILQCLFLLLEHLQICPNFPQLAQDAGNDRADVYTPTPPECNSAVGLGPTTRPFTMAVCSVTGWQHERRQGRRGPESGRGRGAAGRRGADPCM